MSSLAPRSVMSILKLVSVVISDSENNLSWGFIVDICLMSTLLVFSTGQDRMRKLRGEEHTL